MSATVDREAVRPAHETELAYTARIHERHLPSGFFARLGTRFLRRYHQVFAESPEAEVFVAQSSDGPQGVLVGTFDNAAHYRWALRRRGVMLALVGLVAMLRRPRLAKEFLASRVGRYARALARWLRPAPRRDTTEAAEPARRVAVLTHVAVEPAARGRGTGRELVSAFVRAARRRGADEVRLITPADGPGARFYRALGWRRLARRRAADDTLVEEFQLPL
jgi:ribosomal protein S18 acetylase RimI-like enzyme